MIGIVYYIEINLTCMLVLALLLYRHRQRADSLSVHVHSFDLLTLFALLLCAADLLAGICRGQFFTGARGLIEVSNLVYFEAIVLVSYQWMRYVFLRFGKYDGMSKQLRLALALPLIAFTCIAVTNPLTNFMFSIDQNNLYVRGPGVFLHWTAAWFYFAVAFVMPLLLIVKEKSKVRRREISPYLTFAIAPGIASVIQMSLYGVTSIQVGVMLSVLLLFTYTQNREILTDPLTGLNNRRRMEHYFAHSVLTGEKVDCFIVMIDLNKFKNINDTYGHSAGDEALRDAAKVLRAAAGHVESRVMLCRYGGDEFVVAGKHTKRDEAAEFCRALQSAVERRNRETDAPYRLSFAYGTASGVCETMSDVEQLFGRADDSMYRYKKDGRSNA